MTQGVTKKKTAIYLAVFIAAALAGAPLGRLFGSTAGAWVQLLLPCTAMLALRLHARDWGDISIQLNGKKQWKFYLIAALIYPYITVLVLGLGRHFSCVDTTAFTLSRFVPTVAAALLAGLARAALGELSWRGYLVPKLQALGLAQGWVYAISGLLWGLCNCAYVLWLMPENQWVAAATTPVAMLLVLALTLALNVTLIELRAITQSLWPCVLLRATMAIPAVLFAAGGMAQFTKAGGILLHPLVGILPMALVLFIGLGLRSMRIKNIT